MKKISFLLVFSFITSIFFGQDTIFKRNNDKIIAKISEITSTEIKYKKFDFQDGPLYVDRKAEIKMIIYSNGTKELFEEDKIKPVNTTSASVSTNKIENFEVKYRYHNSYISQSKLHSLLLETKDKKIMYLVGQAKDARILQYIGFAAIPLGIAALANLEYNPGRYQSRNQQSILAISGVCVVAAITCPIISGVKRKQKKKFNSEAIRLYNQKF